MRLDTLHDSDWKEDLCQKKRPVVTIAVVIINVAVWCILELIGNTLDGAFIAQYGGMYPELVRNG